MLPTPNDVHVNGPLTNISLAFMQNAMNFVSWRVFPNIPVAKQSDVYFTYDRGDWNRSQAAVRAPGAPTAGGGYRMATDDYRCKVHGIHRLIPRQAMSNADSMINLGREAADWVALQLMLEKEKSWVDTYFAAAVWTNDYDGNATAGANQHIHWDDDTSGTPIENIRFAKTTVLQSTGFEPNTLVMGQQVYDALVDHPDIVDRVKYSGGVGNGTPAKVNEQTLAALLDLDNIYVAKAIQNTAAEGATNVHSFVAGKDCLLCYVPPSPGLMTPSAGYTFSWTGHLGVGNEFGMATKAWFDEKLDSTYVEGETAYVQKLVSADLGFFWDGIVT